MERRFLKIACIMAIISGFYFFWKFQEAKRTPASEKKMHKKMKSGY